MNSMSLRLAYVDRLKGFAIFLVVLGHVIQMNVKNYGESPVFNVIYSFHMPFFFFLSGYVAEKASPVGTVLDYATFVRKKAAGLLLPLFAWPLVGRYAFTQGSAVSEIPGVLWGQLTHPELWFLHTLFRIFLVYGLLQLTMALFPWGRSWSTRCAGHGLVLAGCLIQTKLFPGYSAMSFALNYGFFAVGALLSRQDVLQRMTQWPWVFGCSAIAFSTLAGHYEFVRADESGMKGLKVGLSLAAAVMLYNLATKISLPARIDRFLCRMGQASLVIYVTHFSFLYLVPTPLALPERTGLVLVLVVAVPVAVLLMWLSVGVSRLVQTIPVMALILYGKSAAPPIRRDMPCCDDVRPA